MSFKYIFNELFSKCKFQLLFWIILRHQQVLFNILWIRFDYSFVFKFIVFKSIIDNLESSGYFVLNNEFETLETLWFELFDLFDELIFSLEIFDDFISLLGYNAVPLYFTLLKISSNF